MFITQTRSSVHVIEIWRSLFHHTSISLFFFMSVINVWLPSFAVLVQLHGAVCGNRVQSLFSSRGLLLQTCISAKVPHINIFIILFRIQVNTNSVTIAWIIQPGGLVTVSALETKAQWIYRFSWYWPITDMLVSAYMFSISAGIQKSAFKENVAETDGWFILNFHWAFSVTL